MRRGHFVLDGHEVIVPPDSPLPSLIRKLKPQLEAGNLSFVLRELDRAWRTLPARLSELAPIYARALVRDGGNPRVAIKLLERCLRSDPTADFEADLIRVLERFGRADVASRRLDGALQRFALIENGALACAAQQLMQRMQMPVRGWVGITPDLQIHAEAVVYTDPVVFEIRDSDGMLLHESEAYPFEEGPTIFTFPLPRINPLKRLSITANGHALLGGERAALPSFDIDGRTSTRNKLVQGWVRLGWNPGVPVHLLIEDQYGNSKRFVARERAPESRWNFQLDLGKQKLRGGRFEIAVLLPDGSKARLPDSPLLLESELRTRLELLTPDEASKPKSLPRTKRALPAVDIIIPVYQGRDETLACIESVCRTAASHAATIIVVDDATPDPALAADLDALAATGQITLLRNPVNLGFSASVNRGMAFNENHDAVLVNADVIVFDDWLPRLRHAAYSAPQVGTATPFCDDDSIAGHGSEPKKEINAANAQVLDRFASVAHRHATVEIPVGVGFCLYLRRDCWRDTGPLDDAVFGKGYGEESDYCMRARTRGWTHVLAADVFVHHAGGRSFGSRRAALQERALRLMNLRHKGYNRYVARYLKADPLHRLNRGFDEHRLALTSNPFVLIVTLSLKGGVDRFIRQRMRQLLEEGRTALILRPHERTPDVCMLWSSESHGLYLRYDIPQELGTLQKVLGSLNIESVEFHHFLGIDEQVVAAALRLGVPYDVYVHDYSWVCPRITMIDESGAYCGQPDTKICERCIRKNGTQLEEKISVRALRQRSEHWLAGARRVIAPSHDTVERTARYLPGIRMEVVPHEPPSAQPLTLSLPESGVIRVAVLGAIGAHKGFHVLRKCAEDAAARGLNLEFVIIGHSQDDKALFKTGKILVTGEYSDAEIPQLLKREAPQVILLPSVWPETWCYTLTHALASGLPVVAFDLGAIAERLRAERRGVLLPLGLPASDLNEQLMRAAMGNILEQGAARPRKRVRKR